MGKSLGERQSGKVLKIAGVYYVSRASVSQQEGSMLTGKKAQGGVTVLGWCLDEPRASRQAVGEAGACTAEGLELQTAQSGPGSLGPGERREGKEGLLVSRDRCLASHFLFRNSICLECYFLSMTFGPGLSVPVVTLYLSEQVRRGKELMQQEVTLRGIEGLSKTSPLPIYHRRMAEL